MTIGQFLTDNTSALQQAGIDTARLDCLVLLEDATGFDRARLLAHPELPLNSLQLIQLNNFITQRKTHLPLAYIRGKAAFFGRDFAVNNHVLVPRPETEIMLELLTKTTLPARPRLADVGTGSGCIGITAALEIPGAIVFLYDIDADALQVAAANAQAYDVRTTLSQQDLLGTSTPSLDVILANLPYVPNDYAINKAATFEPGLALFAGADGLEAYRRLWQQVTGLAHQPQHILTESLTSQHQQLAQLGTAAGYDLVETQGLIQHFRKVQ
jgi:release factor glutamine methyltransferase